MAIHAEFKASAREKPVSTHVSYKYYAMKIILSDAESCEEHDKTKHSLTGQTMAELRSFLCLDVEKITEKNEN